MVDFSICDNACLLVLYIRGIKYKNKKHLAVINSEILFIRF